MDQNLSFMTRFLSIVLTSIFFAVSLSITAQKELEKDSLNAEDEFFLSEIESLMSTEISTAGKKSEKVADIPASVVIITREDVEKYGYNSLMDIIQSVPGFYNLGNANFQGNYNFGVRGFSSSGEFNDVMVLLNGVNQMEDFSNSFNIERFDVPIEAIDRVEVIRGPMAVLYGSNAFMGVINIITNEKQNDKDNKVAVSASSLYTQEASIRFSGQENDLKYTLNYGIKNSEGMDVPYSSLVLNEDSVLPANYVDLNETTKGHLGINRQFANLSLQHNGVSANFNLNSSSIGRFALRSQDLSESNIEILSGNFKLGFEKELHKIYRFNLTHTYSFNRFHIDNDYRGGTTNYGSFDTRSIANETELLNHFTLMDNLNFTLGASVRYVPDVDRTLDYPVVGRPNVFSQLVDGESINTCASFIQANYSPIERLKITAGIRAENTEDFEAEFFIGEGGDSTAHILPGEAKNGGIQFAPRIATIFSITPQQHIKLLYGVSKKRPAYVHFYNVSNQQLEAPKISTMESLELNYLGNFNNFLGVNFSTFYNKTEDLLLRRIVTLPNGINVAKNDNNLAVSTQGIEASFIVTPSYKMKIEFSTTYQNSQYTNSEFEDVAVYLSPDLLMYLKARYDITNKISIGLKSNYVAGMNSELNITTLEKSGSDSPSNFTIDANIRMKDIFGSFFAQAFITNITDQEVRYPTVFSFSNPDQGMLGFGRRLQLKIGYQF